LRDEFDGKSLLFWPRFFGIDFSSVEMKKFKSLFLKVSEWKSERKREKLVKWDYGGWSWNEVEATSSWLWSVERFLTALLNVRKTFLLKFIAVINILNHQKLSFDFNWLIIVCKY
jgi:hypothetical protein